MAMEMHWMGCFPEIGEMDADRWIAGEIVYIPITREGVDRCSFAGKEKER